MPAGVAYHPRAARADWNTPEEVVKPLVEFCSGDVDLDPCSNPFSIVPARRTFSIEDGQDGLVERWGGTVFVNPPFSNLREWAQKADVEAALGAEVLLLMPARTDTRAMQDHVSSAQAVLFWRGRLKFLGAKQPAPFPVALAYWGERLDRFLTVFGRYGLTMVRAGRAA